VLAYLYFSSSSLLTRLPNAELFLSKLNLSFSTHLRKLRFLNFKFRSRLALSSTIPSMLARATSSHISEIEFAYCLPERRPLSLELENDAKSITPGSSMWRALDDVLSTFSGLRTVRFTLIPRHYDHLPFIGYVKRGLSSCNARGLLSFERPVGGMCKSGPELGACYLPPFCTEQDLPPPYFRPTSLNGTVIGPFCIAQLQEPRA
jgi:hypothetical protein